MKTKDIIMAGMMAIGTTACDGTQQQQAQDESQQAQLEQDWDKTFPLSDKVSYKKVTFHNRYGITLVADLYMPKDAQGKLPAIAVSGPFGAVKEQV